MPAPKTALEDCDDTWEYPSVSNTDVTDDPESPGTFLGCPRWWQTLSAGDVTFVNAAGRTVTYTGLAAKEAFGVRIKTLVSAPGRMRVGW